jgi:hypothetical protein
MTELVLRNDNGRRTVYLSKLHQNGRTEKDKGGGVKDESRFNHVDNQLLTHSRRRAGD